MKMNYTDEEAAVSQILTMVFFDMISEEDRRHYFSLGTPPILERLRSKTTINMLLEIWYSMNARYAESFPKHKMPPFYPFDLNFCHAFFSLCMREGLKPCGTKEEMEKVLENHYGILYSEESLAGAFFSSHKGVYDPYTYFGKMLITKGWDKEDRFKIKTHFFFIPNIAKDRQIGKEQLFKYVQKKYDIYDNFETFSTLYDTIHDAVEHVFEESWWDFITEHYYKNREI